MEKALNKKWKFNLLDVMLLKQILLCYSLNDKNIPIYTFNIAQVKLLKKNELPNVNITLLNDDCKY